MKAHLPLVAILVLGSLSFSACAFGGGRMPLATASLPTSTPLSANSDLELSVSVPTDRYLPGDVVPVTISLKNIGDQPRVVNTFWVPDFGSTPEKWGAIELVFNGPSGRLRSAATNIDPLITDLDAFFKVLAPGEAYTVTYLDLYSLAPFYEPGDYTLRAIYRNQFDPGDGRVAWKGELISNRASFSIEPPPTNLPGTSALALYLDFFGDEGEENIVYSNKDDVQPTLHLKNIGTETLLVSDKMKINEDVLFKLIGPSNQELLPLAPDKFQSSEPFSDLAANKESARTLFIFGELYDIREPGKYFLQAVYQNQSDPGDGRTAWKGEIKSNVVTFTFAP